MRTYFQTELEKGNYEIKCMNSQLEKCDPRCKRTITFEDMQQFATQAQYNKYEQLGLSAVAHHFQYCPTPDCGYMFDRDPNVPTFRCPRCSKSFCFACNIPNHEGMNC